MGGMIWGIGSVRHDATELDEGAARYINDNLADYLIAVNADVAERSFSSRKKTIG
jgi:xanthine dehydrogenase YagR molybdenum-binding subunit